MNILSPVSLSPVSTVSNILSLISQLPKGWVEKRLIEVTKFIDYRGKTPKKTSEGLRLLTAKNVKMGILNIEPEEFIHPDDYEAWMTRGIPQKGDVLFTTEAPLANVALLDTDEKIALAQRIITLCPDRDVLTGEYLNYCIQSKGVQDRILEKGSGATVTGIKSKLLKEILIPIPPLEEQKQIVEVLDQVFADIEQARAKTEQNLKNARELFESYLQQVFSQRGEGWVEKKIEDLTTLITKGSSPKWQGINYVETPGILFVTSENVGVNKMIYKKTKFVEEAFNKKGPKSILAKGDVLTNIVGASIGRTAIYDRDDIANINQAVCLMRCDSEFLFNEYLAYLLNSPYLIKVLHDNEIDNARANLSLGFFRKLGIPIPSVEEQKNLIGQIKAMHSKANNLEVIYQRKLDSLDELKKSILQKAFKGELTSTENKGVIA